MNVILKGKSKVSKQEQRKPLLAQLVDTVRFFSQRKTVGKMKTEHSIFIPTQLMINQAKETEEFIKVARDINQTVEWHCPVVAEKITTGKFTGVEFIFQFSPDTDFDAIIEELESRLEK